MSWNSFFLHDLRRGLFRKRALVPAAQFFLLHFSFWLWARKLTEELTLGDFLFHLFSGVPALQKLNGESFHIPALWMQIFACSLYLHLSYPISDLTKEGEQFLVRSGSRINWFLSKCGWCLCGSLFYYASAFISAWGMTLAIGGKVTLYCSPYLVMIKSELPMRQTVTAWDLVQALIILPLLTVTAVNFLQMVLSFWLRPVYGFLICVTVLTGAVLYPSPFLLGNGAMLLRSGLFFSEGGSAFHAEIAAMLVILLCVPAGALRFRKYDIIPLSGGMTL